MCDTAVLRTYPQSSSLVPWHCRVHHYFVHLGLGVLRTGATGTVTLFIIWWITWKQMHRWHFLFPHSSDSGRNEEILWDRKYDAIWGVWLCACIGCSRPSTTDLDKVSIRFHYIPLFSQCVMHWCSWFMMDVLRAWLVVFSWCRTIHMLWECFICKERLYIGSEIHRPIYTAGRGNIRPMN